MDREDACSSPAQRVSGADVALGAATLAAGGVTTTARLVVRVGQPVAGRLLDLPEIIRGSSGSLMNESIHGVRLQTVDADRAVERLVDRLLRRQRVPVVEAARTATDPPPEQEP